MHGAIGSEYAGATGQGRITLQTGPDPVTKDDEDSESEPLPDSRSGSEGEGGTVSGSRPLAETGDDAGFGALAATAAATVAAVAGASAVAVKRSAR